jgi:hypothetical protein
VGPVSIGVLKALAQNGTIEAQDLVWHGNGDVAAPAFPITHLAPFFGGRGLAGNRLRTPSPRGAEVAAAKAFSASASTSSFVIGLLVGCLILVLLNLPVATVEARNVFWWHAFNGPGMAMFVTCCLVTLVIGMALCIVTPLTDGIARGITLLCLGTVLLFLDFLVPAMTGPGKEACLLAAILLTPTFAAMLVSASRVYGSRTGASAGRASVVVWAALLSAASLLALILMLSDMGEGPAAKPTWAVTLIACLILQCLTGLAAGILGIVCAKPTFSRGLNLATTICGLTCWMIAAASLAILAVGLSDAVDLVRELTPALGAGGDAVPSGKAIGFLAFRVSTVFFATVTLLAAGLQELLAALRVPGKT